eukprot:306419-Karenia_brevis.AAC.1
MCIRDSAIEKVDALLKSKYTMRKMAESGDADQVEERVILNRVVRWIPKQHSHTGLAAMEIQADLRHAEFLAKELGLDKAKAVETRR